MRSTNSLSQSLAYEQAHVPSQGFLQWLDSGEAEIKRDQEAGGARDQLRIMTVHGAKGLQAPIVFLPDTLAVPTRLPPLLWPEPDATMLWAPGEGAGEPIATAARAAAQRKRDQEYRRLLYVALTRAEDRLYVCGWATKPNVSPECWYSLIRDGMGEHARSVEIACPRRASPSPNRASYMRPRRAPTPSMTWRRLLRHPRLRPCRPGRSIRPRPNRRRRARWSPRGRASPIRRRAPLWPRISTAAASSAAR
ncbi:MAG: 3'-5' exonuclease [Aliidongia sp.]